MDCINSFINGMNWASLSGRVRTGSARTRCSRINLLVLAGLLLAPLTVASQANARTSSPYVVTKIKIDARARNAVLAKKKALKQGPPKALKRLLKRLVHFYSFDRIPDFSAAIADDMVKDFAVYKERNSATRYIAVMQYRFQTQRVRELLRSRHIPFLERQARRTTIVPVFMPAGVSGEKPRRNPWSDAWIRLDLENTLTPFHVTKPLQADDPNVMQALRGHPAGLRRLRARFGTGNLMLVVAGLDEERTFLTLQVMGKDAVGRVFFKRRLRLYHGDLREGMNMAARMILAMSENRWKQTQMLDLPDKSGVASLVPAVDRQESSETDPVSGFTTVVTRTDAGTANRALFINVHFRGLREWQRLRRKLVSIPGMETMEVSTITARGADIRVTFPGGAKKLARQLKGYGLRLEDRGGALSLRTGY